MKAVLAVVLVSLAVANAAVLNRGGVEPSFNSWATSKWPSLASDFEYAKIRLTNIPDADVRTSALSARGIVITAANPPELSWAVASVRVLRLHSSLPVELFHNDLSRELVQQAQAALADANVRFLNVASPLPSYTGLRPVTLGFQMYAVMHSSFQQVLYLNAATTLVADPAPLFARLSMNPGLFFSTGYKANLENPVFDLLSLPLTESYTQDTAIFVVDSVKAWSALSLASVLTSAPLYQHVLDGAIDAVRLAFEARGVAYELIHDATALLAVKSETGAATCASFRAFGTKESGFLAVFSINGRVIASWTEVAGHTCLHGGAASPMEEVLPGVHATLVAAHEASQLNSNACHRFDPRDIYTFLARSDSKIDLDRVTKGNLVVDPYDRWNLPVCGWFRCGSYVDTQDANTRFFNFSTRHTARTLDVGTLWNVMSYANQTIVQVHHAMSGYYQCETNNRPEGSIITGYYLPPYSWVVVSVAWDPYYEPMRYSLVKALSFAAH